MLSHAQYVVITDQVFGADVKPWEPDEFECDVKGVQKGGAQKGRGRRVAQMKTGADESEGGSIQGRGERGVSSAASDSEER